MPTPLTILLDQVVAENTNDSRFDRVTREVASMVQSGQNDTACKDMAQTLINATISKAEDITKMFQALDNGAECPIEDQEAVQKAQKRKTIAGKNVKERELKSLEAQEALKKANGAKDKAAAEDKASDEALATTVQTAVVEVKTCQCKAKATYVTRRLPRQPTRTRLLTQQRTPRESTCCAFWKAQQICPSATLGLFQRQLQSNWRVIQPPRNAKKQPARVQISGKQCVS